MFWRIYHVKSLIHSQNYAIGHGYWWLLVVMVIGFALQGVHVFSHMYTDPLTTFAL